MPSTEVQFASDLAIWGPECATSPPTFTQAETYCRSLARRHYENFPLASWMLPRRLHQHFFNVYAYCRWADDLGDEIGDKARSGELLGWWRGQLEACYRGSAMHPVFVALKSTIEHFAIPKQPFDDLISAFEQDQRVTEYESFGELRDYCRRSADPVGRIVLYLCESFSNENAELSDSICTGLQLANFWQDVGRDFDIGRIYLPRESRRQFGCTDEDLHRRSTNEAFIDLMRFEVTRARQFLVAGLPLVDAMPGRLQIDIELFARGGLAILDQIERIGYRVWERRPVVRKSEFARLFFGALGRSAGRQLRRLVVPASWRRRGSLGPGSVGRIGHDELPALTDSAGTPQDGSPVSTASHPQVGTRTTGVDWPPVSTASVETTGVDLASRKME
jgi:squalene synthase HpnC